MMKLEMSHGRPNRIRAGSSLAAGVLGLALTTLAATALAAAGDLDGGFGTGGKVTTGITHQSSDFADDVAIQSDGKVVAAGGSGEGELGSGGQDFTVVRYNANGTLDTSFGGDGIVTTDFGGSLSSIARSVTVQADGAIVVAGFAASSMVGGQGPGDFALARYESDGDPDSTFSGDGKLTTPFAVGSSEEAQDVAIQADGKIVAAGSSNAGGSDDFALARYTTAGALDTGFSGDGLQTVDIGTGSSDNGAAVAIQPSAGAIVVAGTTVAGSDDYAIARLTVASGSEINKLTTDIGTGSGDSGFDVAVDSSEKIVVAGSSNDDFATVRYLAAGTGLDTAGFGGGDGKVVTDMGGADFGRGVAIQPSGGEIVVAGTAEDSGDFTRADLALARYDSAGAPDASFGGGDGKLTTDLDPASYDEGHGVAVKPTSGEIVVAGASTLPRTKFGGSSDFILTQYEPDGDLDPTFSGDGKANTVIGNAFGDRAEAVAVQADGKIVVAGLTLAEPGPDDEDFAVARYQASGLLDPTFDGDGVVTTDFGGMELADGANGVAIQPDGMIVVAGATSEVGTDRDFAVARYEPDGDLDPSFGSGGKVTTEFGTASIDLGWDVAIQSNGEIVVAGSTDAGGGREIALARYEPDGDLDDTTTPFSADGKQTTGFGADADGRSVAIQSNGAIVVGGHGDAGVNGGFIVARYLTGGSLDAAGFSGPDGIATVDFGASYEEEGHVAIQSNGAILIGGTAHDVDAPAPSCQGLAPGFDLALARFESDGDPDLTFSGDSKLTADFGGTQDDGQAVAVQSDGAILFTGQATADFALARYTSGGAPDTGFSGDGMLTTDIGTTTCDGATDVVATGAGILVAGSSDGRFALTRYLAADPAPSGGAAAPSNAFTVGGLSGKALSVSVTSTGTVTVTDAAEATGASAIAAAKKLLKPSSASGGPGTIKVTLKLNKAGKQKLRQKGKVRVNARITFTPTGGTAASKTARLKIKAK